MKEKTLHALIAALFILTGIGWIVVNILWKGRY
jgi:hypothetical protein